MTREEKRLQEAHERKAHWKRWGPYLSERAWGTVREDYSPHGTAWDFFPHDHARSRAYRWNEDGIAGICDRHQMICFAIALWNGRDPILKERVFGLTGNEGNHGEDVKEYYFYLDSTPTHSYMTYLYKYPQAAFPYGLLVEGSPPGGRRPSWSSGRRSGTGTPGPGAPASRAPACRGERSRGEVRQSRSTIPSTDDDGFIARGLRSCSLPKMKQTTGGSMGPRKFHLTSRTASTRISFMASRRR